jgi:hypothetical protein
VPGWAGGPEDIFRSRSAIVPTPPRPQALESSAGRRDEDEERDGSLTTSPPHPLAPHGRVGDPASSIWHPASGGWRRPKAVGESPRPQAPLSSRLLQSAARRSRCA